MESAMLRTVFRTDPAWGLFDRQVDWMLQEMARPIRTHVSAPRIQVRDDATGFELVAEVPGLKAEDLEIQATRDTLVLKGARKVQAPEGKRVLRRERPDVSLDTTYAFENEIDPDQVVAKVADGLLTITAAPARKIEPKKITVQVR
jgi:HSP20 family protein